MEITTGQWIAMAAAGFGIGLGKGGLPGLGNVAIAVCAMVFPARLSVGILLPVLMAADVIAVLVYRRDADWKIIWKLLPWTLFGVGLGALLFGNIGDRTVEILIGSILLFMTGLHFLRKALVDGESEIPKGRKASVIRISTGLLGGFATMVANAAGPIAALYLIFLRMPKITFVGTLAWFFLIVNASKLPIMIGMEIITLNSLKVSSVAMAMAVIGVLVARAIVKIIPQRLFEWLIWIFVVGAGIQLLLQFG